MKARVFEDSGEFTEVELNTVPFKIGDDVLPNSYVADVQKEVSANGFNDFFISQMSSSQNKIIQVTCVAKSLLKKAKKGKTLTVGSTEYVIFVVQHAEKDGQKFVSLYAERSEK